MTRPDEEEDGMPTKSEIRVQEGQKEERLPLSGAIYETNDESSS